MFVLKQVERFNEKSDVKDGRWINLDIEFVIAF